MPHFSPTGHDMVLCQFCGRDCDSGVETFVWVEGRGNKCPRCVAKDVQTFTPAPGVTVVESESKEAIKHGPVDLKKYNGVVTVKNPATGNHRTFKIHTAKHGNLTGSRIVSVLIGSSDYLGVGFVNENGTIVVWKKHRGTQYEKNLAVLTNCSFFIEKHNFEYRFSVKCRICNRELTDPKSIDLGIGPVCRGEGESMTSAPKSPSYRELKDVGPISLAEHCRQESGGLEGMALTRYINRYYGHN